MKWSLADSGTKQICPDKLGTVKNIGNFGGRYVALMGTCQEMRILRPTRLKFCRPPPRKRKTYQNGSCHSKLPHSEKWVVVYRKKPNFQVSFLMVTYYLYFNLYHHNIFIYICIYHTSIYTTHTYIWICILKFTGFQTINSSY